MNNMAIIVRIVSSLILTMLVIALLIWMYADNPFDDWERALSYLMGYLLLFIVLFLIFAIWFL